MDNLKDEKYVDHEVRIRLLEGINSDIRNLLKWILGVAITAVAVPLLLHKYGLA